MTSALASLIADYAGGNSRQGVAPRELGRLLRSPRSVASGRLATQMGVRPRRTRGCVAWILPHPWVVSVSREGPLVFCTIQCRGSSPGDTGGGSSGTNPGSCRQLPSPWALRGSSAGPQALVVALDDAIKGRQRSSRRRPWKSPQRQHRRQARRLTCAAVSYPSRASTASQVLVMDAGRMSIPRAHRRSS